MLAAAGGRGVGGKGAFNWFNSAAGREIAHQPRFGGGQEGGGQDFRKQPPGDSAIVSSDYETGDL